jgi:ATP-binding cassette, subfamily C, bacterial CydC
VDLRLGPAAAATVDLLAGAGELSVFGTSRSALQAVMQANQRVARAQARSATARGVGAAASTLAAGTALWACLGDGRLSAVSAGTGPGAGWA